jgi:hypothetical protein
MNVWIAFALGAAAHVLAALAASYSRWRFNHIADPDADNLGFLEDLRSFARWLVQGTAGRLLGQRNRWSEEYEGRPEAFSPWS